MFCSRDYQLTSRFNQQNEKSTSHLQQCFEKALFLDNNISGFPYTKPCYSTDDGNCVLDYQQQELVASMHIEYKPKLSL